MAINPVLAREMRSRMRGRRSAILLTFWLAFNGMVLAVVYTAAENIAEQRFGFAGLANTVSIGRGIYEWTLFAMLMLMLLIIPAQAAGAIAGERERQTLIPLQVTLLSPRRILVGKVTASVAFLVLLVVAALPLLAVGYLVGGVTIGDILVGAAAVLFCGLVVAGMCISISTYVRRVQAATVLCYTLVLALSVGTLLLFGALAILDSSRGSDRADPPNAVLLANPLVTVADLVGDDEATELPSPFDGLYQLVHQNDDQSGRFENDFVGNGPVVFDERGGPAFVDQVAFAAQEEESSRRVEFWMASGSLLAIAALCSLIVANRLLRTPAETER